METPADSVRLTRKTIVVMGPGWNAYPSSQKFDEANQIVLDELDWNSVLDALSDQLPKGFYCKLED